MARIQNANWIIERLNFLIFMKIPFRLYKMCWKNFRLETERISKVISERSRSNQIKLNDHHVINNLFNLLVNIHRYLTPDDPTMTFNQHPSNYSNLIKSMARPIYILLFASVVWMWFWTRILIQKSNILVFLYLPSNKMTFGTMEYKSWSLQNFQNSSVECWAIWANLSL